MEYESLVFEGGGVKGISYLGSIQYLEEKNLLKNIKNFGGSSAGSYIAALLSVGYTSKELRKILFDLPMESFKGNKWGYIRDIIYFFRKYGYYDGKEIEKYFDKIIGKKIGKKGVTFKDAFRKTGKHLKITGTCLDTRSVIVFDYINYPTMLISKAMHISSAIPFFFRPVKYLGCTFVDGGCLENFPINIFNEKNEKTLGIELVSTKELNKQTFNNMKEYTLAVMNTLQKGANKLDIPEGSMIITINVGDTIATNFNLSLEEKNSLIKDGYNTLKEKL